MTLARLVVVLLASLAPRPAEALALSGGCPDIDTPPPKYITLGMPKSGSSAVHAFMLCNGVPSVHQRFEHGGKNYALGSCIHENAKRGKPLLAGIRSVSVSQMDEEFSFEQGGCFFPQISYLAGLFADYPDATFILHTRDPLAWLRSADHWGHMLHRIAVCNLPTLELPLSQHVRQNHTVLFARMLELYQDQAYRVRTMAARYGAKLYDLNIDSPDAPRALSRDFGFNASCWRKANANTRLTEKVRLAPRMDLCFVGDSLVRELASELANEHGWVGNLGKVHDDVELYEDGDVRLRFFWRPELADMFNFTVRDCGFIVWDDLFHHLRTHPEDFTPAVRLQQLRQVRAFMEARSRLSVLYAANFPTGLFSNEMHAGLSMRGGLEVDRYVYDAFVRNGWAVVRSDKLTEAHQDKTKDGRHYDHEVLRTEILPQLRRVLRRYSSDAAHEVLLI